MMRPRDERLSVYVCTQAMDFRKGMASLAVLVGAQLGLNPFTKSLYVFRNRSATAVKLLYWERNGFCLWQKRLEQERFCWPKGNASGTLALTPQQLNWLLEGYDINRMMLRKTLDFKSVI
ncbi:MULTISPECIES: IS66 family insertion sequence element accessory protein TnpB [Methylomonas]|nr:IS66 family insertion sequence element accessory protein TnpB [Methylomonas koyamae]